MSNFFIDLEREPKPRFNLAKFMAFSDNFDPLTSNFLNNIKTLKLGGEFQVQGEEGRPDWISYKIYGDSQYWWILLYYNSLFDSEQVTPDKTILYPDQTALENFYYGLKLKQQELEANG